MTLAEKLEMQRIITASNITTEGVKRLDELISLAREEAAADALDELLVYAGKYPLIEEADGTTRPMTLDEMAAEIKAVKR